MIGRADIEGSKSNVAMNAWLPQASYPCGNFSDTPCLKLATPKGSIGHAFAVCIHTENPDQVSFCPFALREVSVLTELTLGHLRYSLTDVPPQSNSPPDTVFRADRRRPSAAGLGPEVCAGVTGSLSASLNKQKNDQSSGISPTAREGLPLILRLSCLFTKSD